MKTVTVHYPDGDFYDFRVYDDSRLFQLDSRWDEETGVYYESNFLPVGGSYFLLVEMSEDKSEVWMEYVNKCK